MIRKKKFPLNLPDKLQLFRDQHGKPFAETKTNGNPLALAVGSKQLDNIIRNFAHDEGVSIRKHNIKEINEHLVAHAEMSGNTRNVYLRVAPTLDGIELDVGDEANTRILIKPGEVKLLGQGSTTFFHRPSISKPMVMPAEKGNLDLLKKYLNLSDTDLLLLIAFISYTLAHPKVKGNKYVILVIQGDQGTGKTSICNNIILPLIDPNLIGTQIFPYNAKNLAISSQNSHVLCFDNMRNFRAAMSDILCIASTGGALGDRVVIHRFRSTCSSYSCCPCP